MSANLDLMPLLGVNPSKTPKARSKRPLPTEVHSQAISQTFRKIVTAPLQCADDCKPSATKRRRSRTTEPISGSSVLPMPKDLIPSTSGQAGPIKPSAKFYCFGDVHGELEGFKENLKRAKLVDDHGNWRDGNSSTMVQMGDVVDRGPKSVESYQYLEQIQLQALKHSGKVIRLIGNHELNLLEGNFSHSKYQHPDQLAEQIKKDIISHKIQAAYWDGKYLYLHGGLCSSINDLLVSEIRISKGSDYAVTPQDVVDRINDLLITAVTSNCFDHPIFKSGISRKGSQPEGGVFWADFKELHFCAAPGVPQIVAHTPPLFNEPPIRCTESLGLICVDAGLCAPLGGKNAFLKKKESTGISFYVKVYRTWHKTFKIPK